MAGLFLKKVEFWNFTGQETKKKKKNPEISKEQRQSWCCFCLFFNSLSVLRRQRLAIRPYPRLGTWKTYRVQGRVKCQWNLAKIIVQPSFRFLPGWLGNVCYSPSGFQKGFVYLQLSLCSLCVHHHMAFTSYVITPSDLSVLTRTLHWIQGIEFRAHVNPVQLKLLTPSNTIFPNKVTFTGTGG